MYAIIQAGGRQVRVEPGTTITIDRMAGDAGQEVKFEQVLFVERDGGDLAAGAPFVASAYVVGVIDGPTRGPKIRVFRKKRRKGMRKTRGHRADQTRVRITEIHG